MVLRIGLTGGIGSGKSTVAGIFSVLGIPVFDADSESKKIMESDPGLVKAIKKAFGEKAYQDGHLDKKYLSSLVFNDFIELEKLNALVHPYAIAAAEKWASEKQTGYVVKEAALFFEAGSTASIDYMVGVFAPKHLRIKRTMDRDKISREDVLARMQKQIQEEIKMRLCDFVIINDEQQLIIPQVLKLHEQFLQEAKELNNG